MGRKQSMPDHSTPIRKGFFATVENTPPTATDPTMSVAPGNVLELTLTGSDADTQDVLTFSIVSSPENGQMIQTDTGWTFSPKNGYRGQVAIPFSLSDGVT